MYSNSCSMSFRAVVVSVNVAKNLIRLEICYKKRSLFNYSSFTVHIIKGDMLFDKAKKLRIGDEVKADPMMDHEIMACLPCSKPKRLYNAISYKVHKPKDKIKEEDV